MAVVVDERNTVVAACLEWADVVRDGVVLDFYGATQIVKRHLAHLNQVLGVSFESATTSFPPGTDPRISVNVLQAAGLEVSAVIDEPSAVAHLLDLDKAAVLSILAVARPALRWCKRGKWFTRVTSLPEAAMCP